MGQMESFILDNIKQSFAFLAILTGAFLVPVNSTMITIGLQNMMESFNTTLTHISWIITIYLLLMIVMQPLAGKLGDVYGRKRLFIIGLLFFLVGSIICMMAPTMFVLMIGRAIQAIGGALISPNGTAILRMMTPKEKLAKTFGIFGFVMSIGAAIGPLLGALLIHYGGWQATFWVNIPLLIVAFIMALMYLPAHNPTQKTRIDLFGAVWLGLFLAAVVLLVTLEAYDNIWLWVVGISTCGLFIYRECTYAEPLIHFSLFKNRHFTGANMSILLNNWIMYATLLLLPIALPAAGYTLTEIGLLLFVFSIAISCASWLGGRLEKQIGRARLIALSFTFSACALTSYLFIVSHHTVVVAALLLLIGGIGSGLGVPSMQTASLQSVDVQMSGIASGIYSTFRYIGSTAASVIISMQFLYATTIWTFVGVACIGICMSRSFATT